MMKYHVRKTIYTLCCLATVISCRAQRPAEGSARPGKQVLAFPGAEGYGKFTSGGRGGKVILVTNLEDDGPGSLRAAIDEKVPRTILFTVSGTIALKSPLKIRYGNVTIAGQSAPGDGICLKNYVTSISADNVIVRYLRFRLGDMTRQADDSFNGTGHKDIIIDHCSMSWAVDENASFYNNEHFTMQWCIIAESLHQSVHFKGAHGYGGIWGGKSATFHHNLLAHNTSRNPRFNGQRFLETEKPEAVDFRNNAIVNWSFNSSYGGEGGNHNMVNNYYEAGPATRKTVANRIVNPADTPSGKFYVTGNFVKGFPAISENNWAGGVQGNHWEDARTDQPVPFVPIEEQSATAAFKLVLEHAGASLHRDAVDTRIIEGIRNGKMNDGPEKNGIINSQTDVGGWPELRSLPAPLDTDGDGMPDEWEKMNKLDPADPKDAVLNTLDRQFTNIEIYLNQLVKSK
ncbi:MAG: pectate lyase [Pseudobacter sp.]|uniref:pectate lyase n=1 Tax=Pseudobacter sp. TaxID=2045420 RepID=UPI003F81A249